MPRLEICICTEMVQENVLTLRRIGRLHVRLHRTVYMVYKPNRIEPNRTEPASAYAVIEYDGN